MRLVLFCIGGCLAMCTSTLSFADDCSKILDQQITYVSDISYENLAIATTLDEETYNRLSKSAGVGAIIYGIPISATYGEYSSRASKLASSLNLQKLSSYSHSYLETRLDQKQTNDYINCLNPYGLSLTAKKIATKSGPTYTAKLKYITPPGGAPIQLSLAAKADSNISDQSLKDLADAFGAAGRQSSFDLDLTFSGKDPMLGATLTVSAADGAQTRSVSFPATIVPQYVSNRVWGDSVAVRAGWGQPSDYQQQQACVFKPVEAITIVPGSGLLKQSDPTGSVLGVGELTEGPDFICQWIWASNSSGVTSAGQSGKMSALMIKLDAGSRGLGLESRRNLTCLHC